MKLCIVFSMCIAFIMMPLPAFGADSAAAKIGDKEYTDLQDAFRYGQET